MSLDAGSSSPFVAGLGAPALNFANHFALTAAAFIVIAGYNAARGFAQRAACITCGGCAFIVSVVVFVSLGVQWLGPLLGLADLQVLCYQLDVLAYLMSASLMLGVALVDFALLLPIDWFRLAKKAVENREKGAAPPSYTMFYEFCTHHVFGLVAMVPLYFELYQSSAASPGSGGGLDFFVDPASALLRATQDPVQREWLAFVRFGVHWVFVAELSTVWLNVRGYLLAEDTHRTDSCAAVPFWVEITLVLTFVASRVVPLPLGNYYAITTQQPHVAVSMLAFAVLNLRWGAVMAREVIKALSGTAGETSAVEADISTNGRGAAATKQEPRKDR